KRRRATSGMHSALDHARRLLLAAHGGQILCSEATAALARRDLEPGVKLTDLGLYRLRGAETPERLFEVDTPRKPPGEFPPPNADPGYTGSLPLQFSRFYGREVEITGLQALLGTEGESVRLITLTGTGGTGKTRLALEVGRSLLGSYKNAVWFVPLAALS